MPGRIYEEKSGTKFVYLRHCNFRDRYISYPGEDAPEGTTDYQKKSDGILDTRPYTEKYYVYVRWTNALAKALGDDTSFNHMLRVMAAKKTDVYDQLSIRESPRKFVKEVQVLFDPTTIVPEKIRSPKRESFTDYRGVTYYYQYEYEILPYKKPE